MVTNVFAEKFDVFMLGKPWRRCFGSVSPWAKPEFLEMSRKKEPTRCGLKRLMTIELEDI